MTTWQAVLTMCGLALVTLLTRAFFLIPQREVPLPGWLQKGLRYAPLAAPLAALLAIVVPEIVMTHGRLIATWQDARLYAVASDGEPPARGLSPDLTTVEHPSPPSP